MDISARPGRRPAAPRSRLMRAAIVVAIAAVLATGAASRGIADTLSHWKGAETFSQTKLGPNPDRCGAFPRNLEASFAGTGIDTAGGMFQVTASGCLDTETSRVTDLEATDTFPDGGSLFIVPEDFTLVLDETTCVATNSSPVGFSVAGGTGRFAGASGSGSFHFAMNDTACNGLVQPVHVWFSGVLKTG